MACPKSNGFLQRSLISSHDFSTFVRGRDREENDLSKKKWGFCIHGVDTCQLQYDGSSRLYLM